MEFLYLIPNIRKRIFKETIIKAAFIETGLYQFDLEKVLSKLPLYNGTGPVIAGTS